MRSTIRFYVPSLAFPRAARAALRASSVAGSAARIWARTLEIRASLKTERKHHSPGVDLLLRYGEWDCALYRALRQTGMSSADAGLLVEQINWAIFGPVTRALFHLSRLRSARLRTRVRWTLDVMFLTLFTSPFERHVVPAERDVAFEVTACPLALFCNAQGTPELTRHAACNMDVLMARDWGVLLERTGTIAEGHPVCDFRFRIGDPGGAQPT